MFENYFDSSPWYPENYSVPGKENKKVSYRSLAENWLTPCMTEGVFKIKFSWKLTTEENYSSVTDKTCSFNLNFRT